MKHNRTRVLRWSMERTRWVRSIRAWRNLLPDWTPTLDEQVALETMPHEHRAAVAVITEGWEPNDPRWDVFMALLEWERRNTDRCRDAAEEVLSRMGQGWDQAEMDQFLSIARQRVHMPQGVDVCSLCGGAGHAAENCPGTDPPPALRQDTAEADPLQREWEDTEALPECRVCKTRHDTWFDRSVCPEPCGSMHDRCQGCGASVTPCPLEPKPKTAIIPVKVVTSQGQTLSETTLETPIKAAFLDRLTPVKHLREKQGDA